MKKIIFFFGSFDPLHKGHISILESAIKEVDADYLYLGLNKNSKKGKLTSYKHRYNMLKVYAKNKEKIKILDFSFDYKDIEKTYNQIFSYLDNETKAYILIGQDQLANLQYWHDLDLIKEKFDFIVAKRNGREISKEYLNNSKYIFIDHVYKNISSLLIKKGEYNYTNEVITNYILSHNLYLKEQIKSYLTKDIYKHTISVCKTALMINKNAKLGLDKYKVEKAALLHDIAKNLDEKSSRLIMKEEYGNYLNEDKKIIHQYLGEYIAREKFYVHDEEILNAIKYHTTGRAKTTVLEKLIYVSDKIEPNRDYDTNKLINLCIKDFDKGFIKVLKNNKNYLIDKEINVTNVDTINCFNYYLK